MDKSGQRAGRFGESFARDGGLRNFIRIGSVTPQPACHEGIGEVVLALDEAGDNTAKNQVS